MTTQQICLLALLGVFALTVLKKWSSDLLPPLRLAIALLLFGGALVWLAPTVAYLQSLTEAVGLDTNVELLLKALAVALLTQLCATLCRESGEGGIAEGVELAGKAEILLLALPLLSRVLELVLELLNTVG